MPPQNPCRLPPAFSLVELLAVIAVIVIVSGFVVPAVTGIGRSTALVNGGNMATNLANLARQTALSKNTMTALVVLGNQGTTEDYRALTVLEYVTGGGGWAPVTAWQTLPDGIVVDTDKADSTFLDHSPSFPQPQASGQTVQKNPPVFYRDQQVKDGDGYAARIFLPSGGLQNSQDPAQLRVIEGFLQNGRLVRTKPDSAGKSANFYDLTIIGATGVAKVSRP